MNTVPTTCQQCSKACYPYSSGGQVVSTSRGGCGSCGNPLPMMAIGEFTKDVCLEDCIEKFLSVAASFTNGTPLTVTLPELVRCLFTFDSLTVKLGAEVGVNQACTVFMEPSVAFFGAGASHHKKMPIYCNYVQQVPTVALAFGAGNLFPVLPPFLGVSSLIPTTMGQFELQINPFANAFLLNSESIDASTAGSIVTALNWIPALAKFKIAKGTPIFQGYI